MHPRTERDVWIATLVGVVMLVIGWLCGWLD